jgi:type IV secretion system protein VirD4
MYPNLLCVGEIGCRVWVSCRVLRRRRTLYPAVFSASPSQPPASGREIHELSIGDRALVAVGIVGAAVLWMVFAGAWLAARLTGHDLGVDGSDGFAVLGRLWGRLGDPAAAWPEPARSRLPGPWLYWPCTAAAGLPLLAVGWWWVRRDQRRLGLERRVRLGVDAEARMATVADLTPILVDGPQPRRMILGTVHGRLVATEAPQPRPTTLASKSARLSPTYRPTRGSVMVVGPSQSGKSTLVICGVLEWCGPAILSSVKTDLIHETFGWRSKQGDCRVYDPCKVTGLRPAAWSPLRGASSWGGAQAAAHAVRACAPPTTAENAAFFETQMERLLAGYLWVAAFGGRDMRDVNRWICAQDAPSEVGLGEVATLLQVALAGFGGADPLEHLRHRPDVGVAVVEP